MRHSFFCLAATAWWLVAVLSASAGGPNTPDLAGEEVEFFLATAEIVSSEKIDIGITRPQRLKLTDGDSNMKAVWKTVEIYRPRQKMGNGRVQLGFRDSYRSEIAAYRLSVLLDLGIVPPTVERIIENEPGSMQLWMENCITELERKMSHLHAPDVEAWNQQMATVRLFHQLIHDTDFNNINNILVTDDFRVWIVDSSRGFYLDRELRNEEALNRFSRSLLDRLQTIDKKELKHAMGGWLSGTQIKALLHRRNQILDLADRRVAELGEDAVLFP